MKKTASRAIFLALALSAACAFAGDADEPQLRLSPVKIPGRANVYVCKDLPYGPRQVGRGTAQVDAAQTYDLYLPGALGEIDQSVPFVLFVHGGAYQFGSKTGRRKVLAEMAERGFAVASMNYVLYRKEEPHTFAEMLADIDAMVSHLSVLAKAAGISMARLALGGSSAGAHLSLLYAYDQANPSVLGLGLRHGVPVACVFTDCGPSDIASPEFIAAGLDWMKGAFDDWYGLLCVLAGGQYGQEDVRTTVERLAKYSPVTLLNGKCPPTICLYGATGSVKTSGTFRRGKDGPAESYADFWRLFGSKEAPPESVGTDGIVATQNYVALTNGLARAGVPFAARIEPYPHCKIFARDSGACPWLCENLGKFLQADIRPVRSGTFEEMVPMKDGTKLYTYGVRPAQGVKCPIVIQRNPYVKERPADLADFAKSQAKNLARGYAYLVQHCRGCGMSEGDWIPYENERSDGLALLEWVRKLPWYNGEIFLDGGSYLASVHWSYLETNPPDVKGAALSIQDVDRYNVIYRNGFFKIGLHGNWYLKGYKKKNRELKRDKSVRLCDFPLSEFSFRYWGAAEPSFDMPLAHPLRDDPYWLSDAPGSGACFRQAFAKTTMPILLRTAFYDIYTDGVCDMWREAPRSRLANCALLIDAYDHGGKLSKDMKGTLGEFPGGSRNDEGVSPVDWFDYCRTGKACVNAAPGKVRYYALWENRWIEADSLEDAGRRVEFALGEGERSWVYDPKRPLPDFPGGCGISFGGMRKQPEPDFRDDVASFVLPPLKERLDVRGRMKAVLSAKSDCEDTCFYIRVSVKKHDGGWYLLRDDITSLSANGGDYVPGTMRRLEFRFADHAFRLEKGDQLRVDVASASSQFAPHGNVKGLQSAVREPKVAHNAIDAARSCLVLPCSAARTGLR